MNAVASLATTTANATATARPDAFAVGGLESRGQFPDSMINVWSDERPFLSDVTVQVNGRGIAVYPADGRLTDGRVWLIGLADSVVTLSVHGHTVTVPIHVAGELSYTKSGQNAIYVARRAVPDGPVDGLWEIALVNQAVIAPQSGSNRGRSTHRSNNWYVTIHEIAGDPETSLAANYVPTADELAELVPGIGIVVWWHPASLTGLIATGRSDEPYLTIHYNGFRRAISEGDVSLPLEPMSGAFVSCTTIRVNSDGKREAAGLRLC